MNKFLQKLAKIFLGISMAAGVGVAIGTSNKSSLQSLALGGTDTLNRTFTGVSGTSYTSWSGKTGTSGAVYAGNSAGPTSGNGNNSIQLRSTNNSGIITTTSGGTIASVSVTWHSYTTNGRQLDFYGKTTAYSSTSDLYTASTQGTKIGSLVYGTSSSFTVDGTYSYIGIRSYSNAQYISSIQIVWSNGGDTYNLAFGSNDVKINATSVNANDSYGNSWTIATAGTTSFTQNAAYSQVGSSSSPATSITFTGTLSSSSTLYDVSALSIKLGGFSGTAGTVTLKVQNGSSSTTVGTGSLNATSDVTVSSTSTGRGKTIVISITSISKGVKVYGINYTKTAVTNYTVTFAVNTVGYGTVSESSLSVPSGSTISTNNNIVTINGTTVTATPTANTAQYTYTFSSWTNASGTVTAARTITANFERTINTFTVGGTINNGSLSSTASIAYGSALNIEINADTGYVLPETLTLVKMGDNTLVAGSGYNYNNSTGAFSIASVTGNVVINATCPLDGVTYNISGTIDNGNLTGDIDDQAESEDYVVQISPSKYFKYPTSINITGAGVENTGWEYDADDGLVYIYGLSSDVSITATCPAASITSISVTGQKSAFTLGEEFSFGGTVKATYNDAAGTTDETISTDLVDIDSSDYDPYTEANNEKTKTHYTIEISLKADSDVSITYNVTVTKKSIQKLTVYDKVASTSFADGDKVLIVANCGTHSGFYAMATYADGNNVPASAVITTESDTRITEANMGDALVYTLEDTGETNSTTGNKLYYLHNSTSYLYAASSSSNHLKANTKATAGDNGKWEITVSSGVASIVASKSSNRNVMQFNHNNGNDMFSCYASASQTSIMVFKENKIDADVRSLIRLTATGPADLEKVEDDEVSVSDFVATALFDTTETATVTPTIVSVNGESPTSHLVEGSNTVVLSYTDPNHSAITKTCEVTVVAAEQTAELDGITWDKEAVDITQFEGSTIVYGTLHKHFDDDSTIILDLAECTVAVYTKSGLNFVKDHDIANPTAYTLDLDDDNGKYLGVSYSGYTKYSGKLSVVETIGAVVGKVESWTVGTTKLSSLEVGNHVVMTGTKADGTDAHEYNGITNHYGSAESYSTTPAGTSILEIVAGSANGSIAFKDSNGDYLSYYDNKGLTTSSDLDGATSWTISFNGTDVTITNVGDTNAVLQYNSSSPRFCTYESAQRPISFYLATKIYIDDPEGSDIANTNVIVQKAVLEYAVHFNETMACIQNGSTLNVSGKWEDLEGDFDDLLGEFTQSNLVHCKALFAGADAVDGGDTLQDMLARYEYIVGKYKTLNDFLHTESDRPEVQRSAAISPLTLIGLNGENANTIAIIVIISMVSVTAIGGYFFLRKRKENI